MIGTSAQPVKSLWSSNPIPAGCVKYFPLWSPSLRGSVFRSIDRYRLTGTVSGALQDSNGRIFDGNDYILIGTRGAAPDVITGTSLGTLVAWVRPTTLDSTHAILGYGQENVANPGYLDLNVGSIGGDYKIVITKNDFDTSEVDDKVYGDTTLSVDTWYCMAFQSTGSAYKLYLGTTTTVIADDGINVSSGADSGDWFADVDNGNPDTLSIGGFLYDGGFAAFTKAKIKDIAYFDEVLTLEELIYWQRGTNWGMG